MADISAYGVAIEPHDVGLNLRVRELFRLLKPHQVIGRQKVRVGGDDDGGYVMIDDFEGIRVCYSLGVGPDVSFDDDLASKGIEIYQYDHTVEQTPLSNSRFHFFKQGIAGKSDPDNNMYSLQDLMFRNGHSNLDKMILKFDIEDAEWEMLESLPDNALERFSQIVGEFHYLSRASDYKWCERFYRVFRTITKTHALLHVHANNWGPLNVIGNVPVPDLLELTFVNRSTYRMIDSIEVFPGALDRPCHPERADIFLGTFQF